MSKEVKKRVKKDVQKKTIKRVSEQQKDLEGILPSGDEGLPLLSVELSGMGITIPLDIPIVKDVLKRAKVKNRTVLEISGVKVGVDVI